MIATHKYSPLKKGGFTLFYSPPYMLQLHPQVCILVYAIAFSAMLNGLRVHQLQVYKERINELLLAHNYRKLVAACNAHIQILRVQPDYTCPAHNYCLRSQTKCLTENLNCMGEQLIRIGPLFAPAFCTRRFLHPSMFWPYIVVNEYKYQNKVRQSRATFRPNWVLRPLTYLILILTFT